MEKTKIRPRLLGSDFSSLTHTINISFVIAPYLLVMLFACLLNCFIGRVFIERVVAKVFPGFFFNDFKRLEFNNHLRPKRLGFDNHAMVGFVLGFGMIAILSLLKSNKKLSGGLKIN